MEKEKIAFIEDCIERKLFKHEIKMLDAFEKADIDIKRNCRFMIARGRSHLNLTRLLLANGLYEECRLNSLKYKF